MQRFRNNSIVNGAIGGYLDVSANTICENINLEDYILLNSGRNALKYILLSLEVKHILVPYYTCPVVFEAIKESNVSYTHYSLNDDFVPRVDPLKLGAEDWILINDYLGLSTHIIKDFSQITNRLIVDAAQALFTTAKYSVPAFFSPRKYTGLSDGGIVTGCKPLSKRLETDFSYERLGYLFKRVDLGAEAAYKDYRESENSLNLHPIRKMSKLTETLIYNIDWSCVAKRRIANFRQLNKYFFGINKIALGMDAETAPLCYPLFIEEGGRFRDYLVEHRVYTPTYWEGIRSIVKKGSFEYSLVDNLVCLPIDQRYGLREMDLIIQLYEKFYQNE